jgi:hypothetical protein
MRRILALVVAILALSACTAPITSTSSSTPPVSPLPMRATATSGVAPLGGAITYADGLVVSTSTASAYTPGDSAYGMRPDSRAIRIGLKISNGTKSVYDPALVTATLSSGSEGVAADSVVDMPTVSCSFTQKILPGRSASTVCAFALVKDQMNVPVQMQVGLGFDLIHSAPIFTGKA